MSTEIESRYLIPDRLLFDRLRRLDAIGPFRLKRRGAIKIVDYYLDTPGRAILHQGWACRLRSEGEKWLITLKGPKKVSGSIVSRPEFEITIPGRIEDVARWPRGRVRKQVTELTGGLPLRKLVAIRQTRHKFDLFDDLRPVAELSLDAVRTIGEGLRHRCYMVECELGENGREADLVRLDATLVGDFALMPESRSKLQRALELVERAGSPDEALIQSVPPSSVESVLQRYGVDLRALYEVVKVSGGNSRTFEGVVPQILERDFDLRFKLKHAHKDVTYMTQLAREQHVPAPLATTLHTAYTMALATGLGDENFSAFVRFYEKMMGVELGGAPADGPT